MGQRHPELYCLRRSQIPISSLSKKKHSRGAQLGFNRRSHTSLWTVNNIKSFGSFFFKFILRGNHILLALWETMLGQRLRRLILNSFSADFDLHENLHGVIIVKVKHRINCDFHVASSWWSSLASSSAKYCTVWDHDLSITMWSSKLTGGWHDLYSFVLTKLIAFTFYQSIHFT